MKDEYHNKSQLFEGLKINKAGQKKTQHYTYDKEVPVYIRN